MIIKEGKMIIDDIVNTSYKCLKATRLAEKQMDYPDMALLRLEEASSYLEILRKESPLMYSLIQPEYLKVLKQYDTGFKIIK